jgi:hypothetical protein
VEPRKSRYLSRPVACWRARIRVLERLRTTRGLTLAVQADNGPELRGRTLDHWAYEHGVQLQFIAGQAGSEHAYRELQCEAARRMPE